MSSMEDLVFSRIAKDKGFVKPADLALCQRIRDQAQAAGLPDRGLGEILADHALLTPAQLTEIRTEREGLSGLFTIGSYQIVGKLGVGGMGTVYKALDSELDRFVAIKLLKEKIGTNTGQRDRFRKEARGLAKLNHPNILSMHGFDFTADGQPYMVMEFIEGTDLARKIKDRGGILPEREALEIVRDVALALQHAYEKGLIHRDVKPGNVLIDKNGHIKLSDFGLVKSIATGSIQNTIPGFIMGTPNYISPEQARTDPSIDIRADIYSLGATLYQLVTGRMPFYGSSAVEIILKHLSEPLVPPDEINRQLSRSCTELVSRMMAKNRDDRFATPAEVVDAIDRALVATRPADLLAPLTPAGWPPGSNREGAPDNAVDANAVTPGFHGLPGAGVAASMHAPNLTADDPAGLHPQRNTGAIYLWLGSLVVASLLAGLVVWLFSQPPAPGGTGDAATAVLPVGTVEPPAAFLAAIPLLGPDEQAHRVLVKLKELNPGFNVAQAQYRLDEKNSCVLSLDISSQPVVELWPVRALTRLENLNVSKTRITGLSALTGLQLKSLSVTGTAVADLAPVARMPLTAIYCDGTKISSLAALEGMALKSLSIDQTPVTDLAPLRHLPLEYLVVELKPEYYAILKSIPTLKTVNGVPPEEVLLSVEKQFRKAVSGLPASQQIEQVSAKLKELNPGLRQADLKFLLETKHGDVVELDLSSQPVRELWPVQALTRLEKLNLSRTRIADLAQIADLHLQTLWIDYTDIQDLKPIAQMPLTELHLDGTRVSDLAAIRGLALRFLSFNNTSVADLAPLNGMPLNGLAFSGTKVVDLSALKYLPLEKLWCDYRLEYAGLLKSVRSLKLINDRPAEDVVLTREETFLREVSVLPPAEQVTRVVDKLKELNPDIRRETVLFDLDPAGTYVLSFDLSAQPVREIWPVYAFTRLEKLNLSRTQIDDLARIAGLHLHCLWIDYTDVKDLKPIAQMPLKELHFDGTNVSDLAPIRSLALSHASFKNTQVSDLSPLSEMPLAVLALNNTPVVDLTPLQRRPITDLSISRTKVTDMAVLQYLPLENLWCDYKPEYAGILRSVPTLKRINDKPVADVILTPDELFIREMAALPPVDQVRRVVERLKELNPELRPEAVIYELDPASAYVLGLDASGQPLKDIGPLQALTRLEQLNLSRTQVDDLSRIAGLPLKGLWIDATGVLDLKSLARMPLTELHFDNTAVADLLPLKGLPLVRVSFKNTPVADLAPLNAMPLTALAISGSKVTDLSVLKSIPLENLWCDYQSEYADLMQSLPTLKQINDTPVADVIHHPEDVFREFLTNPAAP